MLAYADLVKRLAPHISAGHTLVETLVVLAIIGVLMATAMPHYVRAIRSAKRVAVMEGKRQENLVRNAGGDGARRPVSLANPDLLRDQARRAYRTRIDAGDFDFYVTELIFRVSSDAEFRAYWHTLIDRNATGPIVASDGGGILARDPDGNTVALEAAYDGILPGDDEPVPIGWDFLATELGHSAIGDLGASVLQSDGTSYYARYPDAFPVSRTVAELSQRFMDEVAPFLQ
jgi:prepilin-type N-terminal cleavage/methylation domain-containing protein